MMATTLDQVLPGRTCRIHSLRGAASLVQRLLELGMMEGEQVTVVNKAPLGDPIEVECALTRLSLRKSEAAQIQVNLPD
jgi:ferrous iron transport protein A